MRYLIDGYNLLHAMGVLNGRVGPHGLERARLALLGRLLAEHGDAAPDVTVVFDAAGARPGAVAEEDHHGVHVRYALDGEADDVIEELIRRDPAPRQLSIVSDDHRIQHAGRRRRCAVLGCMEYLDQMERTRRPKGPPGESPAKPDGTSGAETQHWLREFADLVEDPKLREALGPDFGEEP